MSDKIDQYLSEDHITFFEQEKSKDPSIKKYTNTQMYKHTSSSMPDSLIVPDLDIALSVKRGAKESKKDSDKDYYEGAPDVTVLGRMMDAWGDLVPEDDFWMATYEKGMAGGWREWEYGEPKFDLDELNLTAAEDFMSGVASMIDPMGALTMFAGKAYGTKRYNKYVNNLLDNVEKKVQAKVIQEVAKKGTVSGVKHFKFHNRLRAQVERNAWPLSIYNGAQAFVDAKRNNEDPWRRTISGVIGGAIMSTAASGAGVGFAGMRGKLYDSYGPLTYSEVYKRYMNRKMPGMSAAKWTAAKTASSKPIEILTKAGAFTTGSTIEDILAGKDLRSRNYLNEYGESVGLITFLETGANLWNRGKILSKSLKNKLKNEKNNRSQQTFKNVEDDIKNKSKNDKLTNITQDGIKLLGEAQQGHLSQALYTKIGPIEKDFDDLMKASKDGEIEAFNAIGKINFLESDLKDIGKDLEKIIIETGPEAVLASGEIATKATQSDFAKIKEEVDILSKDLTSFKDKLNEDLINELNKGSDIDRLDKAVESMIALDMPLEMVKAGKKVAILDKDLGGYSKDFLDNFTYKDLEAKISKKEEKLLIRKGIKADPNPVISKNLSKKEFIKKSEEKLTKDIALAVKKKSDKRAIAHIEEQFDRKKALSEIVNKKPEVKLTPKERIAFDESNKYIDYLLQNIYPGKKYRGSLVSVDTILKEMKTFREFAENIASTPGDEKSFKNMTSEDIESYVNAVPGSKDFMSNLIKHLQELQIKFPNVEIISKDLQGYDRNSLPELKAATGKEKLAAKGEKWKDIVETPEGRLGLDKMTYKVRAEGIRKRVPASEELQKLLNELRVEMETRKRRPLGDDDYIFEAIKVKDEHPVKGGTAKDIPLNVLYLDAIIDHLNKISGIETKRKFSDKIKDIDKELLTRARAFRNFIGAFTELAFGLDRYAIIDKANLGHRDLTDKEKGEVQDVIKKAYSAHELENPIDEVITEIFRLVDIAKTNPTSKELKNAGPLNADMSKPTQRYGYTIRELAEIFNQIEKMGNEIVIEIPELTQLGSKKGRKEKWGDENKPQHPFEITLTNKSLNTLLRTLVEWAPRLDEVVLATPKNHKTTLREEVRTGRSDFSKEIDLKKKEIKEVYDNKKKAGELGGNEAQNLQDSESSLKNMEEQSKKLDENKKPNPFKDEKRELNKEIHNIERKLEENKKFTKKYKNSIRMQVFKTRHYDEGPKFTLDQFRRYKSLLEEAEDLITKTTKIDKIITKTRMPRWLYEDAASVLSNGKTKDPNELSLEGKKFFVEFMDEYSPNFKYATSDDLAMENFSDSYLHRIQTGENLIDRITGIGGAKPKKFIIHGWILARNISTKSRGDIKKSADYYYQTLGDYQTSVQQRSGVGSSIRENIVSYIKKNMGSSAVKNGYWAYPEFMEPAIKAYKNPKTSPEEKSLLKDVLDNNMKHYNNSKIPGTHAYIAKQMLANGFGVTKQDFLNVRETVNSPAKGTKKYDDIIEHGKKIMDIVEYMPHIPTNELKDASFNNADFERKLKKAVKKEIKKRAMEGADEKFPDIVKAYPKKSDRFTNAPKKWQDTFTHFKEKLEKGKKKENIEAEIAQKMENAMANGEVDPTSPHFMERGVTLPMFTKVNEKSFMRNKKKQRYVPSYEVNLDSNLQKYFNSTSKYISNLEYLREYMPAEVSYSTKGKMKQALANILRYEQKNPMWALSKKTNTATHDFLNDLIEINVLGIKSPRISLKDYPKVRRAGQIGGQIAQLFGLGGIIEPGVINVMLGQANTFVAHPKIFYIKAAKQLLDRSSWHTNRDRTMRIGGIGQLEDEFKIKNKYLQKYLRKTGKVPVLKYLNLQEGINIQKYIWYASGMKPGEVVNRVMDVAVNDLHFCHLAQQYADGIIPDMKRKELEDWMKNFWRFSEKDVEDFISGKMLEMTPEGIERYNFLKDKASISSHLGTQGGLAFWDAPTWTAHPDMKYHLTFKRIAAAVTPILTNVVIKPLLKYGKTGNLIKAALVALGVGFMKQYIIDGYFKGEENPVLDEELQAQLLYLAYNGEMFQAFGFILDGIPSINPYAKDKSWAGHATDAFEPAGTDLVLDGMKELQYLFKGLKSPRQALNDFAKEHMRVWNQNQRFWTRSEVVKMFSKKAHNYDTIKDAYTIRMRYEKFRKEETGSPDWEREQNPHVMYKNYENIKYAIYWGSPEEIAKYFWKGLDEKFELLVKDPNNRNPETGELFKGTEEIWKVAMKSLNMSIKAMDPNRYEDPKGYYTWIRTNYAKGIGGAYTARKTIKKVQEAEAIFDNFIVKKLKSIIENDKWRQEYSDIGRTFDYDVPKTLFNPKER